MSLNVTIGAIVVILSLVYYYFKRKFSYWADKGIPFMKPEIPFGNLRGVGTTMTNGELLQKCYPEFKRKDVIGGVYFFTAPVLVPVDLDLLRHVFIKDFQYFHDRGMYVNARDDPLSAHLFSIEGAYWKNLRTKLTPTFTSGKMKMMHSILLKVADEFRDFLNTQAGTEIEVKDILARFTTDVIGNAAFGIECNSLKDPNNEFRRNGRRVFDMSSFDVMKILFLNMFSDLGRKLRMGFNKPEVTEFFLRILKETVDYREKNNIKRNDFLALLLQIKNTGKIEGDNVELGTMTFEELAAQTFLFFIAGFETSSSTMTFALYELALNPDIQERAREEVREAVEKHNGVLTYEAALSLTYLDQVINETLRKYPVIETLLRKVTKDYQIPNTKHFIEKDTLVMIPVSAIHHDPEIYPDPEKFDPERFTQENVAARHPFAWIPFGEGPRNCVGMRFGLMQTRVGLATILNNFVVSATNNTPIPIKYKPNGGVLTSNVDINLQIESL